jgi:hypothetical protein
MTNLNNDAPSNDGALAIAPHEPASDPPAQSLTDPPKNPLTKVIGDLFGAGVSAPHPVELQQAIWPSPDLCHLLFIFNRVSKKKRHIPVADPVEGIAVANQYAEAGYEVYFACAEYATPENRKADNVVQARAFWMDFDCGEGKSYPDQHAVIQAIYLFCKTTGLPAPTHLVNSGGGLHVYWVLDEPVPIAVWKEHALLLKALSETLGLNADGARTADPASVLRVPGTFNYKQTEPRPVELLSANSNFIRNASC